MAKVKFSFLIQDDTSGWIDVEQDIPNRMKVIKFAKKYIQRYILDNHKKLVDNERYAEGLVIFVQVGEKIEKFRMEAEIRVVAFKMVPDETPPVRTYKPSNTSQRKGR